MRKGFTLIELLIVIAIIGILAGALLVSLSGARSSGRDARRLGDLRQVQAALELYFNKCGQYPGDSNCAELAVDNWAQLTTVLTASGIGVTRIPKDPDPNKEYDYGVDSTGTYQKYVLQAVLENDNAALRDDVDGNVFGVNCGLAGSNEREYCTGIGV